MAKSPNHLTGIYRIQSKSSLQRWAVFKDSLLVSLKWLQPEKSHDGSAHLQAVVTEEWISHPGLKTGVALLWWCVLLSKQKKILANRKMQLLCTRLQRKAFSNLNNELHRYFYLNSNREKHCSSKILLFSCALSAFTTNALQRTRICTEVRMQRSKTSDS